MGARHVPAQGPHVGVDLGAEARPDHHDVRGAEAGQLLGHGAVEPGPAGEEERGVEGGGHGRGDAGRQRVLQVADHGPAAPVAGEQPGLGQGDAGGREARRPLDLAGS